MLRNLGLLATALAALAFSASPAVDAAAFDRATSFGTKTAYWDQSKDPLGLSSSFTRPAPSAEEEAKYTLVQVQSVIRHGTRFPTKGNIQEIQALVAKLQSATYVGVVPTWLKTYKVPYDVSIEGTLAPTGAEESKAYGARVRKSLNAAVPKAYTKDQFILQHTYKPRTKDTAKAFASTFFENPQNVSYIEYAKDADPLLRFYDECKRYVRDVADNDAAFIEATTFKASPAFQKNFDILRKSLNLPQDANLTTVDIESAFSGCAFDLSLYKTDANWCTLLNDELIKSTEYSDDLETFYESSAGYKLSYEISSVLLRDVYKYLKDFTQNKTTVVGNFRFSHAETTTPLMTLLGYTDKTPLLANATASQIENRKFRGSRVSPLMANVEFRLYKKNAEPVKGGCQSGDEPEPVKYYVQIRINEQVTAVPGCGDKVFCELSKIEKIWSYYLTEYDFAAECAV